MSDRCDLARGWLLKARSDLDACRRMLESDGPYDMTLDQLRKVKRSVGIAGGQRKVAAIRGAMRGGLVNVLITDLFTAQALIASGNS